MRTVNGSLSVNEISVGGLSFTATGGAGVTAGKVNGDVNISEMGMGAVNVSEVRGNVSIVSNKKNGASITVSFAKDLLTAPTVDIIGYDGAINVSNICGDADIRVRDANPAGNSGTGYANIYAHFLSVANVKLTANPGYVAGHENTANITVELNNSISCVLDVVGSSFAWNYKTNENLFNSGAEGTVSINGGGTGHIIATTPSRFFLK
jgi:hypothetical protein